MNFPRLTKTEFEEIYHKVPRACVDDFFGFGGNVVRVPGLVCGLHSAVAGV